MIGWCLVLAFGWCFGVDGCDWVLIGYLSACRVRVNTHPAPRSVDLPRDLLLDRLSLLPLLLPLGPCDCVPEAVEAFALDFVPIAAYAVSRRGRSPRSYVWVSGERFVGDWVVFGYLGI